MILNMPSAVKTIREMQQGIFRYVKDHGPWIIQLSEGRNDEQQLTGSDLRSCDGYIGNTTSAKITKELEKNQIPIINLDRKIDSKTRLRYQIGAINCDNASVASKAADWLIARGFTSFATVGSAIEQDWSEVRCGAFANRLHERGFKCEHFKDDKQSTLGKWLESLPKPVALFAAHDIRARQVLNMCIDIGVAVPRDVAILSVDNDEALCETTSPTLSSIQMSAENAGYEAARLLDNQMRSKRRSRKITIIPYDFEYVTERQSTERLTVHDSTVERAINFMRLNYSRHFTVEDLAEALNVSKRYLELRFKQSLGHSPHAELLRRRLDIAQNLIRSTERSFDDIAGECGFASASHLSHCFSTAFGQTPKHYRNRSRV